ncbi:MAG: T9SS type A sorting domain-containing protein [Flavobacteriia bacterium]|nr:T9SS type A sorting domain-containing protein [Flavobacteriia bacterium]
MKNTNSLKRLLFGLLTIVAFSSYASHFNGGWIYADYDGMQSGKLRYVITFNAVWAENSNTGPIDIDVSSPSTSSTLSMTQVAVLPYDSVYYELRVYTGTILLDANTEYVFSYGLCCRPPGILNIGGSRSAGVGIYIYSELNTGLGNSLPRLIAPLPVSWPTGIGWQSSYRHSDIDGDSISYQFSKLYEQDAVTKDVDTVVMDAAYPSIASIPGASFTQKGMVPHVYSLAPTFSMDRLNVGIDVSQTDRVTGLETGRVHYDFLFVARPFSSGWSKPVLVTDSKMVYSDQYDFRVNRADTLVFYTLNKSKWGTFFYPEWAAAIMGIRQNKSTDTINGVHTRNTRLTVTPSSANIGLTVPMVLRFYFGDNFKYDYHFDANIVSGIGLEEDRFPALDIYPNPSTAGEITVKTNGGRCALKVMTLEGREVSAYVLPEGSFEHVLSTPETPGVYMLLMMNTEGQLSTTRLVVQ